MQCALQEDPLHCFTTVGFLFAETHNYIIATINTGCPLALVGVTDIAITRAAQDHFICCKHCKSMNRYSG